MKKIAIVLLSAAMMWSCGSKGKVDTDLVSNPATASGESTGKMPKFEFEMTEYDFGTIAQGQKVTQVFKFKNVGDADLVISDAKGSCGCTVPTYPEKPIAPGSSGEIEVVFDSAGKSADQVKTVTLYANTSPTEFVLKLKGFVKTEKAD